MRTKELADYLGVGASTVSQALKGPLKDARAGRGKVDMSHPCVAVYIESTRARLEK